MLMIGYFHKTFVLFARRSPNIETSEHQLGVNSNEPVVRINSKFLSVSLFIFRPPLQSSPPQDMKNILNVGACFILMKQEKPASIIRRTCVIESKKGLDFGCLMLVIHYKKRR